MSTRPAVLSLYRRSLKLSLDWAVNRQLWRGQALYIRSLFEKNRDVHDPRQLRVQNTRGTCLLTFWTLLRRSSSEKSACMLPTVYHYFIQMVTNRHVQAGFHQRIHGSNMPRT
ncbi:uncharacterized protein B0T23DRAFT_324882 [Neurospora hispaniola]|uniref:NADH dehydrogenase [ubiquinone] 1 beta subcomplex subunit 9 n=1 Tax=Neurospora hispaniola TaxID=588809 RepID=A0AAJ0I059_9PEZI|nr:hypothetical protein B0T23DRAFT_324882 [Neurospora hispaniola]